MSDHRPCHFCGRREDPTQRSLCASDALRADRNARPAQYQPIEEPRRPRWLDRAAKDLTGQLR